MTSVIYRSCPLCHGMWWTTIKKGVRDFDKTAVCKCDSCNIIFLNPIMDNNSYAEFYNNDKQRKYAQSLTCDNYFSKISYDDIRRANFIKNSGFDDVLDVGAGLSGFVKIVGARGIDISEERVRVAQQNGLNVTLCDIYNWNDRVETITMFHVLEHIVNPIPFLKRAGELLLPGGNLVIEVPNHNDILVKVNGYKDFYYQNAHCTYFTPQTIERILNKAGFNISKFVKVQRYSLDNHINWLINKTPGKVNGVKVLNKVYSMAIKSLNIYDTMFLVCNKGAGE